MKVLLADDERIQRSMLERWLREWDFEPVIVSDGKAALDALRQDAELRLAVLDWVMPEMDGIDICRTLREEGKEPYIYIVLLTARDDKADIVRGLDAGADDYIVKPCNPLELKVRLRAGKRVVELQEQLMAAREALRQEAMHDSLTGLYNHGAIVQRLTMELDRAHRMGGPLSVVMVDIDHFKQINDQFGHPAGDAVLRDVARRLSDAVRVYDSVGRLGGEEFIMVLPGCDARLGMVVAERLRRTLAAHPISTPRGQVKVTVSLGVASTNEFGGQRADQLISAADVALYRAKGEGRNRSVLARPSDRTELPTSPPEAPNQRRSRPSMRS